MSSQTSLAQYFREQARWREMKQDEYPNDFRNGAAAVSLEKLASYVEGLPSDDPRIIAVTEYNTLYGLDVCDLEGALDPPGRAASRIGFDGRPIDPDEELTWYVRANLAEHIHNSTEEDLGVSEEEARSIRRSLTEIELTLLKALAES